MDRRLRWQSYSTGAFMGSTNRTRLALLLSLAVTCPRLSADVPVEGFLPFVGMALTNEFEDSTDPNASPTFFIAQSSNHPGGSFLGQGSSTYFDLAIFDTGAATHILTNQANTGFDILGEQFDGTHFQTVGGATGLINMRISDPLGVYVAGMADRTSSGSSLTMNTSVMRGQTSFSLLSAPAEWTLPNVVGLPMAAQHQIHIQNSQPQIFQLNGRTVRTPNIELNDLGSGSQGIIRRAAMKVVPGLSFIQGPLYTYDLDLLNLTLHENPLSPTVVQNGGLFIETDISRNGSSIADQDFLFDTGASLTIVSEQTAVRLGFDPILDTPDFVISVEGSGGVSAGIPGFYADQLRLDTAGGQFVLNHVPIAVLDVTNPADPGNVVDGILGMNLFAGRDLVIDANPSIGQGGAGPNLYISDPVTQSHAWSTTAASGNWTTSTHWTAAGVPGPLWDATVANVSGTAQEAVVTGPSTVFRATVSGSPTAEMQVRIGSTGVLTLFADLEVRDGGHLRMDGGRLDAQFVQLQGGQLSGRGDIFVGSGPLPGTVRNDGGVITPGDASGNVFGVIHVLGDLANDAEGTLAFDVGGNVAGVSLDQIQVDRFAFLGGDLDISLAPGFTPQVGNVFTILTAAGGVEGTFDTLLLPTGFAWNVNYLATSVQLQITGIGLLGDFDQSGVLDCGDINLLTTAVATGGGSAYDLTGDGVANQADIQEWVVGLRGTLMGDANLDETVDGSDFGIWNGSKFTSNTNWCSGNFTGDSAVDGSDFGVWNSNKFQSAASSVPEPSTGLALLFACLFLRTMAKTRR